MALPEAKAFYPVAYVLEVTEKHGLGLSGNAAHLAVVLAASCRRTASGRWWTWRGNKSIANRMRRTPRSVTNARAELIAGGLFAVVSDAHEFRTIVDTDGIDHRVGPGIVVLELVTDWAETN